MSDDRLTARALGQRGEALASRYLEDKKFEIVERGFRLYRGEIDIVVREGPTLVFIEVKTRADETFGRPEDAVTPTKQRQIRRVATGYLLERGLGEVPCRFDVISILFQDDGSHRLTHFKDAF